MLRIIVILCFIYIFSGCARQQVVPSLPKGMPIPDESIGMVIASIATKAEIEKKEGAFVENKYESYGKRHYFIGEVHVTSPEDIQLLHKILDGDVQGKGIGSFCYDPHHYIYYSSGGEFVSAELCYSCDKGTVKYGEWEKHVTVKAVKPGAINELYKKYGLEIYTFF